MKMLLGIKRTGKMEARDGASTRGQRVHRRIRWPQQSNAGTEAPYSEAEGGGRGGGFSGRKSTGEGRRWTLRDNVGGTTAREASAVWYCCWCTAVPTRVDSQSHANALASPLCKTTVELHLLSTDFPGRLTTGLSIR